MLYVDVGVSYYYELVPHIVEEDYGSVRHNALRPLLGHEDE